MKWLKKGALAGLLLWLMYIAFEQAALVAFLLPTVSIRFDLPLTQAQMATARSYAEQYDGLYLTFWTERTVFVQNHLRSAQAQQITFDGNADLAYPAEYAFGRAPLNQEPETCAVSTGFAWALWGSEEVVGLTVTAEDATCTVVGVFPEDQPLILRPDREGFTVAELQDIPAGEDGYRFASTFSLSCGLGTPDEILWGSGFGGWVQALPWLCLILVGLRLVVISLKELKRRLPFRLGTWCLMLAFFLVLLLPALLETLPPWLIPSRWSDFSFWGRLAETLWDRCYDFLALTPQLRDVQVKIATVKALAASLCVLAVSVKRVVGHGGQ